jgi:hypothetical protein
MPGLESDTVLHEEYHRRLISNIVNELAGRQDLIADADAARAIYSELFADVMSGYEAPEQFASRVPHAAVNSENIVVLSPGYRFGTPQKVLICLLGCAIQQRLTRRSGEDVQTFLHKGGYAQVVEKLILVAQKIGIAEEHLPFLSNSQEKEGSRASN